MNMYKEKEVVAIMMYGYPSTGKTTMAKLLEESLSKNYYVKKLSTLDLRVKLNLLDLKSDKQRNLIYNIIAEEASRIINLQQHDIIIIDGNFNLRERREMLYSVLKDVGIYIIHCLVSDEGVVEKRLLERQKNLNIPENLASTMELYNLIKNSGDHIKDDDIVKKRIVNFIQFNSEKNIIEGVNLNKEESLDHLTRDMLITIDSLNPEPLI